MDTRLGSGTIKTPKPLSSWWLTLIACLMMSCQTHGSFRNGEGILESPDRLQFPGWVKALEFLNDGQTVVAGGCETAATDETLCAGGLVSVWDLQGTNAKETIRFPRAVTAIAVSPDGTKWVAGDLEGRLILSTASGRISRRPLHQKAEIRALDFSPDGQWVASGSVDPSFPLGLMDMKTGGVIKVKVSFDPVSAVAFSRDGKELAIGMQNGSVVTWRFASQATPMPIARQNDEKEAISTLAFSPDDRFLAYGRQDGHVVIFDRVLEQILVNIDRASAVTALVFSPDSRHLALGQENGKVALIEVEGRREIWSKRHIFPIVDLTYSPDGTSLAVAAQQVVFLYQVGNTDLDSNTMPRTARTKTDLVTAYGRYDEHASHISSRKFTHVLRICQDELFWLLPFDRLVLVAVEAMLKGIPGARIEQGNSARPRPLLVAANGRSVMLDLNRLQHAKGREGLRDAVRMFESTQRFLLSGRPGSATALEDAAVSAVISELGSVIRLLPQPVMGTIVKSRLQNASDDDRRAFLRFLDDGALGEKVKYFKLTKLDHSTAKEIQRWVAEGVTRGRRTAYVLDLRDNVGADIGSAVNTAESLLPKGSMITGLVSRKTGERIDYRAQGSKFLPQGFVVLVNEQTAGTAELLACAIREAGIGVLVGTTTAGVDEIYSVFPLRGKEVLRVSTGRFYCPGDRSIRWKGQTPDVEVDHIRGLGGVSMGAGQVDSLWPNRFATLRAVNFPMTDDQQLRVAIEIALCLSQAQLHAQIDRGAIEGGKDAASLLSACR